MSEKMEAGSIQADLSLQATTWLVRLDDDPEDEALRLEFMDWLSSAPAHLAAWEETIRVSGLMTSLGPLPLDHATLPSPPGVTKKLLSGTFFASATIAVALAWVIVPDLSLQLRADQITDTGQTRLVALEDGSKVHLAPNSAIAFTNGKQSRNLKLLRGEAWFDVAPDKARPFKVVTGASTVTVLGTAFSVRKTGKTTDVAVERGRVAVAPPEGTGSNAVMLVAGQSLSMDAAGKAMRGRIRPDRVAVWREGIAIVNDQPIAEVIDRIRPWYRGYILVRGAALQDRRVSGIYDLRHPDQALEALTRAHHVRVAEASPWMRIVTIE